MNWLRTILFSLFFYGVSVPVVLFAPVVALAGSRALRAYSNGWIRLLRVSARWLLGIRTVVEGTIPAAPMLYVAKHQSIFEALVLAEVLGAPAVVMKRELTRIPVWGWCARRYGVIVVDRAANARALRTMMREARSALDSGRSVMIFPEGTRVPPGEAPPLKSGFAGLYRMLGLPVLPVAVKSGHVWPRRGAKRPGVVTLRFGEPFPAGLSRAEAEARAHAGINVFEVAALAPS